MTCITTYDTNLFYRAPLTPTVRRINKSINERLDRYIRAEKLRQAQEFRKTQPCPTLTQLEDCLRVATQPKPKAEWRVITEYPTYEVSTDGQVRNKKTGQVLKTSPNGRGYLNVGLRKDNKRHTKKIHRLVGLTFLPNPDGKLEIDHINRNRTDNRLENLRWATRSENSQNTGRQSNNTTGFKNISSHNTTDRWRIQIPSHQIPSHKISRYFSKSKWTLEQVVNIRNNLYEEHGIQRYD